MTSSSESSRPPDGPQPFEAPGLRDAMGLLAGLRSNLVHHEVVDGRALPPLMAYLSGWQALRLSRTYGDLLRDVETRAACRFFLSDIYAPQDFGQRDYDGKRIYAFMSRFLPEAALTPLRLALEVNELTYQLDRALAEAMSRHLGVIDRFDTWQYEEAYRLCDNYGERLRQIDQVVEVGTHLIRARRIPFINSTLRMARVPAHRLGWHEMHDFLERGFAAWKSLRRPEWFLACIEERERAILRRILGLPGGAPVDNPFLVTDGGPPEIVLADWAT